MATTLLENFYRIAKEHPDRPAISDANNELSYGELLTQIQQVGRRLSTACARDSRVLVLIEDSTDYAAILYGCWAAGVVAVPMNAKSTRQEIHQTLAHVEPSVMISRKSNEHAVRAASLAGLRVVDVVQLVDKSETSISEISGLKTRSPPVGSSDALIVYTSGTTGNPKGVVLTHTNLYANTMSIVEYLRLTELDSVLLVLPLHYSYGNSVLHSHFFVGAKVVIGPNMMYPQQVVNELRESGVTGFSGVPSTFTLILSRTDFCADPPRLEYVTQAGGPMGEQLTVSLREALHPETRLFVMYGQTEATARLTWLPPERLDEKFGSAGKAIPQVEIRVVDDEGKVLGPGRLGQIVARGDNIMRGYWQNNSATRKAVIHGWLQTGDIGLLDEDGFVFIQGRTSEMIKAGAHRISPGEVEEVILQTGIAEEVAVCGVPDDVLGEKIVAFIVGTESDENTRKIMRHCRSAMLMHKRPRQIVWVESLSKTTSGKVRRRELVRSHISGQDPENSASNSG